MEKVYKTFLENAYQHKYNQLMEVFNFRSEKLFNAKEKKTIYIYICETRPNPKL